MIQLEADGISSKPEAADGFTSKLNNMKDKYKANTKRKTILNAKSKPLTHTLDRWFKPSIGGAKVKKASNDTRDPEPVIYTNDDKKSIEQKTAKVPRNFVQRYIHINDECRVCESAKTEEAARCELRCATCLMTVHKKCYDVKGEVSDKDWHCRRCQFIYDETAWEDISNLIGVEKPEGVTFPTCNPPDDKHKLHQLLTSSDFAAVFLFLQRFRRSGLKLSKVATTLENLANILIEPKDDKLCEELHVQLLANINFGTKKGPWYVQLMRFLREEEHPLAIAENTKSLSCSAEMEMREDFYFRLPVSERVAILKFLCEIQFDRNETLVEQINGETAESMRNEPIGTDAAGRCYFVLEDAATVPDAAVWICRCATDGGMNWETVCHDFESVNLLVQQLSLSVESAELQLWQVLSRGALKKLTRQQEKRRRNERRKHDLAAKRELILSDKDGGINRCSLRNRQQVNYAKLDVTEEVGEDSDADSNESDYQEHLLNAQSEDDGASGTDEETDCNEGNRRPRRSQRNRSGLTKRPMNDHQSTRSSKRIRHSPHENDYSNLRRSTRHYDTKTATLVSS